MKSRIWKASLGCFAATVLFFGIGQWVGSELPVVQGGLVPEVGCYRVIALTSFFVCGGVPGATIIAWALNEAPRTAIPNYYLADNLELMFTRFTHAEWFWSGEFIRDCGLVVVYTLALLFPVLFLARLLDRIERRKRRSV